MASRTKRKSNENRSAAPRKQGATARPKAESLGQSILLISLFLVALSLGVYGRSVVNGFVNYDDRDYITENVHVQGGLTGETFRWAFTTYTAGNWHPLTWISHALDVQMFGLSPAGHHLNGMIFNGLNVMLLFLLLWKATESRGRSLVVAALFAVHPLNVECVAWAAERKSLLSTFLFLLALGAYGWYAKRPSAARYGVLASLFSLSLMAKPMVITLPFVLLLLDYWPLQRIDAWTVSREPYTASRKPPLMLVLEKVPLLVLSLASGIITVAAQLHSQAVVPLALTPLLWRVENAITAYGLYLFKAIWPVNLGVFYPETSPKLLQVFLALLVLVAISLWVWRERKQRACMVTGWLWYLGTLVPVIGIVQVGSQAMADRYAYIPLIGIFVMAVWRTADAADSLGYPVPLRIAAVALILLGLSALTWRQLGFWRDPLSLWTHTVQVTHENVLAEDNLGTALMALGRDYEATAHFENAVRSSPAEPKAHIALAFLLQKHGNNRQAIEQCQVALSQARDPNDLLAIYTNLGLAYRQVGNYKAAGESFSQVLLRDPSNATAITALGSVMLFQAAERSAHELDSHPTADGFSRLGALWEQAGEIGRAKQAYQSGLALNANLSSARSGLERLSSPPK
jgi:hypothetical protein